MTSGNLHNEPIVTDDDGGAGQRSPASPTPSWATIAAILSRYDDSVLRVVRAVGDERGHSVRPPRPRLRPAAHRARLPRGAAQAGNPAGHGFGAEGDVRLGARRRGRRPAPRRVRLAAHRRRRERRNLRCLAGSRRNAIDTLFQETSRRHRLRRCTLSTLQANGPASRHNATTCP